MSMLGTATTKGLSKEIGSIKKKPKGDFLEMKNTILKKMEGLKRGWWGQKKQSLSLKTASQK